MVQNSDGSLIITAARTIERGGEIFRAGSETERVQRASLLALTEKSTFGVSSKGYPPVRPRGDALSARPLFFAARALYAISFVGLHRGAKEPKLLRLFCVEYDPARIQEDKNKAGIQRLLRNFARFPRNSF